VQRLIVTSIASAAALALFATPAGATIVEIGAIANPAPPSCPGNPCRAVTRTTGWQVQSSGQRNGFVVQKPGRIVAWTIALAKPNADQIKFFNDGFGGVAAAKITVLRPAEKAKRKNRLTYRVTGEGQLVQLEPYFGKTAQFPLLQSLTVKPGYIVALTVPTWAPALALNLQGGNAWRATRPLASCADTTTPTVTAKGDLGQFDCLYRGVRLTYSATEIVTP